MKYFIILYFLSLFTLANAKNIDRTDFYVNTRVTNADGMKEENLKQRTLQEFVTRVGVRYRKNLNEDLFLDADFRAVYEYINYQKKSQTNTYLEIKRLSLETQNILDTSISAKIGRMTFKDKRTWWYDNELDVLKLFHNETILSWDFSAGGRISDERATASENRVGLKDYIYVIAHLDYQYYYKHHFETFSMYENNNKQTKLAWLGFSLNGDLSNEVRYWSNLAYVKGKIQISNDSIQGLGLDLGSIYKTNNYGFGFSYAYGQGSNANGSKKLFLQPAISNYKDYMIGNTRYRYYGELLDPQLSNMQIISLYGGFKIYTKTWLEVNLHKYMQNKASQEFRSSSLITKTNAVSKDIGQEIDFILGRNVHKKNKLQFIISKFFAGNAFENVAEKKDSYRAIIDFKLYW